MVTVTITVDDAKARAVFGRLGEVGAGNPKVMRAVSLAMKQEVYNAFRGQRAPSGAPWPGLSPLTLKAREASGLASNGILHATGKMYDSTEAQNTATQASVSVGDGLPDARAVWNQFGTGAHVIRPKNKRALSWPGGPGPRAVVNHPGAVARPFLPVTQSAANPTQAWLDAVTAPVRRALEEAAA